MILHIYIININEINDIKKYIIQTLCNICGYLYHLLY